MARKDVNSETFLSQGFWSNNPASVQKAPERTHDAHDVWRQGGVENNIQSGILVILLFNVLFYPGHICLP